MDKFLFTFTKKNPSEFLVEQQVKTNKQRKKTNERRATSKKFHLISNQYLELIFVSTNFEMPILLAF